MLQGSSPLHLAAQTGNVAVAGLLLSKSTQQLHLRDRKGRTALLLAAANGHKEMTQLLIGQGADVNSHDKVTTNNTTTLGVKTFWTTLRDVLKTCHRKPRQNFLGDLTKLQYSN